MSLRLVGVPAAALVALAEAAEPPRRDFLNCRALTTDPARLACYDQAVQRHFLHDFAGQGSRTTPLFRRDHPFRIKYRNDDVVFVIYVYREDGKLVAS